MAPRPVEHPDPERVQQRTVRVLVAAQVLGGAAIGVGAAVSPLLAKEILGDDTFAGVAFAALTFGSALAAKSLRGPQSSGHLGLDEAGADGDGADAIAAVLDIRNVLSLRNQQVSNAAPSWEPRTAATVRTARRTRIAACATDRERRASRWSRFEVRVVDTGWVECTRCSGR
jgi:hypothetical protein